MARFAITDVELRSEDTGYLSGYLFGILGVFWISSSLLTNNNQEPKASSKQ